MKKLSKNEWAAVSLSLVLVAFLLYGGSIMSLFGGIPGEPSQNGEMTELPESGVKVLEVRVGEGDAAAAGDKVAVHYVGRLASGRVFDSSLDRGEPLVFTLGRGEVIRGWDEGIVGMQIGGVRKLFIAPDYGYGMRAIGAIPANSHLIFDVQLVAVE